MFQNQGKCTRCQMVCINQENGEVTKEPLLTLSRELEGPCFFGVYLKQLDDKKDCNIISESTIYIK